MRKRLWGLLATTAIIAGACGSAQSPSPGTGTQPPGSTPPGSDAPSPSAGEVDLFNTAYDPEEGVEGGTIVIGDWQEANQFNPFYIGQVTEANVASAVWANLATMTHDYKWAADLAVEVPTTTNGGVQVPGEGGDAMTVTWTLRDGLKWSDGEPLTCDDFVFSWELLLDPDNVGVITDGFDLISDWECASDTEMVLHYTEVYESYIITNAATWAPLPKHALEDIPVTDIVAGAGFRPDELPELPTSGAFKFESVTPGQELRLSRNENYRSWATDKPANLDTLIFKWYTDPDAMIAGFRGGEVDFATDHQDGDIPKVEDLGTVESGGQMSAIPALLYEFLRPNWSAFDDADETVGVGGCSRNSAVTDRGDGCPMSDPAMREAVAFAVNKDEINERNLSGNAEVANVNISPSAWFYSEQSPATYDPEQAKQILEEAGWTDSDGDGVREKDGIKAKIELCTTTAQVRIDNLTLIASYLAEVGIQAIPNPGAAADIFADYTTSTRETPCVLARSNFDLAEHAFSSSIDPLGNFTSYHSSQFRPNGANDAQVSNPDADAALDTVRSSVDFAVIKDAMAEFQRVYVEQTIEIPLYYRKNVELVGPRLGNFFANPTQQGPTWNAAEWYVKG